MNARVPGHRPILGVEEERAVVRVLNSGNLAQGAEVAGFEADFAAWVGDRPCVAVNSGTSALHLALLALGIGTGDEVVVPSFTFAATANAVALTGATPVFADIAPDTFCLDPSAAEAALTARTAAIMPVHLYGHPADPALRDLTGRHGLALVEDAAQAHGASADGRMVGTWGAAAAFSFYPTKNMTTGEGGMVVCADEHTARKVRLLRNQGMLERYRNEVVGFNTRMTDMAAAIGRVQLGRLAGWNVDRRKLATQLTLALAGTLTTPVVRPGSTHVFHQYTVRVQQRDETVRRLQADGVEAAVYYPIPVHALPAFGVAVDLPQTTIASQQVLSLPLHPGLDEQQVALLARVVTRAVAGDLAARGS